MRIRSYAPGLQAIVVACFFCSGFLALTYEICWLRKASLAFGATSFAISTVLGVFFAGLAGGSYLSGRWSHRMARPVVGYAVIELLIALAAIASPMAFELADHVFGWFYPNIFDHFWAICTVRFALLAAVVLPPALLMGATLPLICRVFVNSPSNVQRSVGFLYGINTLGAAIGCATCGFLLLPFWGVNSTLYYAGICNLAVAGTAWMAARRIRTNAPCSQDGCEPASEPWPRDTGHKVSRTHALPVIFFLSGFAALGNEVVWARFLSLLMYNTVYTYTLTLSVILSGIVLGSFLATHQFLNARQPAKLLGKVSVAGALTVLITLFLPVQFWLQWRNQESIVWQLGLVALVMLPSATLSGIAFPIAARLVVRRIDEVSSGTGWMSALNTVGGLAGSIVVGFVALPKLGLHSTVLVTTAASIAAGLGAWWFVDEQLSRRAKANLTVIGCGLWLLIPLASSTRLPADFLAPAEKLVDFREGLSGHIAVVREQDHLRLEIDRLWQGENRHTHQVVAAHLPMLLHEQARHVLVVGLGPGLTASRFLMYPIERLDCVDIERELLTLLPEYFHGGWLNDPRVHCIVEDGRNFISHTDRNYDVISIEVGQAFRPGVAAFYTREFYERTKRRLRPAGLLTQFVSLEFFNCDELRTVIGTFADVFTECALFHNRAELLLVGKRDGKLATAPNRVDALTANRLLARDLDFSYWGDPTRRLRIPEAFVANFLAGSRELQKFAAGAKIARDDVPWLEFSTSSHRTPDIRVAKFQLERHLSPISTIVHGVPALDEVKIGAIRQRNLDNLLSEDCVWQAQRRLRTHSYVEAIALLREALRWNPDHVGAKFLLADALIAVGDYPAALAHFRASMPGNSEVAPIEARLKVIAAMRGR